MNAVRWFLRRRGRGPRRSVVRQTALVLLVLFTASLAGAAIEDPAGTQTTPPRLGLVEGDVLFWRPGAGDWEAAQVNIPLAAGDALATRDGKFELQIGGKSFVRAADGTQVRLKSHEPDFLQLDVSAGHLALDLRQLPRGQAVEVDTPNGTVSVARDGYYRIDVDAESTRLIVRRGGQAAVTPAGGGVADVATGEAVEISGTSGARLSALAAPPFDDWDRWNYDRADRFLAAPRSYAVGSDVYGADELESHGDWRYVNTYGRVWVPSSVPVGWAPYTYGRWIWDPLYGYSWVDYAPWGWAPYHYGRWVYAGSWAWAPGPVLAIPVYSPALVAFFGGPGISVGIGVPFVSWVALGWGEPLIPWWGPVGFVGSPCWWGWGGPRIVNNITINNGDVVHANSVNFYRNMKAPGAMVGVPKDQFDTRALDHVRLAQIPDSQLKPVHGPLPVPAKGAPGGATAKMPMPDLAAHRSLADATRGGPAPAPNFARGAPQPGGTQRFGATLLPGDAKAGGTTAALDALRNRGPGALTAPARPDLTQPAVPPLRTTNLSRGPAPPPLPGGAKGGTNGAALDALRSRGTSAPRYGATSSGPPSLRSTDLRRAQTAPQVRGAGKPGSSTGSIQHLRTQPPPLPQVERSAQTRNGSPQSPSSSSAPMPRRLAEASGNSGSSGSMPAPLTMRPYQSSGQDAAPSGGMPSLSRGSGGGFGGASPGGMNHGGGAAPNFGRALGGLGGAKLGH